MLRTPPLVCFDRAFRFDRNREPDRRVYMIDFNEEISRYKPSLEVEIVSDVIVKTDLTDMTDLMMELMKVVKDK